MHECPEPEWIQLTWLGGERGFRSGWWDAWGWNTHGFLIFIKKQTNTILATWRRMDWSGTKVDGEESVRGNFRSLSKSCIGLDWVIAVEIGEIFLMAWICVQEAKKKCRGVYLSIWLWSNVRMVLSTKIWTSGWKRIKFSLGNNEFQVAVSHPSRFKKAVGCVGLKIKFGYCVNWSANKLGSY